MDKDILEGAHARLFVVARSWSQPKYPLIREIYKENVWYNMLESYVTIRHSEQDFHLTTLTNLKLLSKERMKKDENWILMAIMKIKNTDA